MIRMKHILAPTDFSEPSGKALKYACAFAEQYRATVHLLHVSSIPSLPVSEFGISELGMYTEPAVDLEPQLREQAQRQMTALIEERAGDSLTVQNEVVFGVPFLEIIQYAKANEIDMIVMGTHGRGAIAHMLLGSTAEKVVRKAPCPVLTVRDEEHEFVMP